MDKALVYLLKDCFPQGEYKESAETELEDDEFVINDVVSIQLGANYYCASKWTSEDEILFGEYHASPLDAIEDARKYLATMEAGK